VAQATKDIVKWRAMTPFLLGLGPKTLLGATSSTPMMLSLDVEDMEVVNSIIGPPLLMFLKRGKKKVKMKIEHGSRVYREISSRESYFEGEHHEDH